MRFIERVFKGISFHWRDHLLTFGTAILFTLLGLFFQTNLMLENMASNSFSRRIDTFSNANVPAANSATTAVTHAHQVLQHVYSSGFWVTIFAFALMTGLIAWKQTRDRRDELAAYTIAGNHTADIASQNAIESLINFFAGFSVTSLVTMLQAGFFANLVSRFNREHFMSALTNTTGLHLTTLKAQLSQLFVHRVTDFNVHSLIFGRGAADYLLDSLGGYSLIFAFGCVLTLIIHYFSTYMAVNKLSRDL
ncbi:hypothetical protein PQ472_07630 [Lacticaseibacillus pabuli]|uniref:DUF599 domain-containing protein n=1 Tax=Lacticaseibacillus pabuli TaxID=3025672 RepID=A0ABY7WNN2_9LACO|nr:hypothetical protein [Lacticaseibacillus sp. KACC 23028]WDF81794.1 hypothetical protein PQ472_07630 [Lacticaseibacillus sp. KACC 23028]